MPELLAEKERECKNMVYGRVNDLSVNYLFFLNDQSISTLEEVVKKYLCLLPSWLKQLEFLSYTHAEDEHSSVYASTRTLYPYLKASVSVYNLWFQASLEDQHKTIIHEFLHINQAQLLERIDKKFPDDELFAIAIESSTESLACAIKGLMQ